MKLLWLLASVGVASAATYGCTTPTLDDTDRDMWVKGFNDARRSMAKGMEPNKCGPLPTGKNVYEMNYDCNLETVAYNAVSTCSGAAPTGLNASYTYIRSMMWSSPASWPNDGRNQAGKQMTDWWSLVQANGIGTDLTYTGGAIKEWAVIANGKNTAFGCAYAQCLSGSVYKWNMICIFNTVLGTGEKVYEAGPACTAAADCTYMPSSTCNDGLCHTDSLAGPPEENNICPATANMNDEVRMAFVNRHNELKSSGVRGLEPDGAGGFAPKGKQSLKYRWDCAIEANAIAWANTCEQVHSTGPSRKPSGEQWGENLYFSSGEQNPKQAATAASNAWWSELEEFGIGQDNILRDTNWQKVGHYTQMAWETTYKLGCAVAYCPTKSWKTWAVCQYGPTGNYINQTIYTIGDPCTSDAGCPAGTTCSVSEGLCVKP